MNEPTPDHTLNAIARALDSLTATLQTLTKLMKLLLINDVVFAVAIVYILYKVV